MLLSTTKSVNLNNEQIVVLIAASRRRAGPHSKAVGHAKTGGPVIDVTPQAREEFKRLGQEDFMLKPYTLDEIGRRIRSLLDMPVAKT